MMLKTILNFKGVEVLSVKEQKKIIEQAQRITIEHTVHSGDSACISLAVKKPERRICKITSDGVFCE